MAKEIKTPMELAVDILMGILRGKIAELEASKSDLFDNRLFYVDRNFATVSELLEEKFGDPRDTSHDVEGKAAWMGHKVRHYWSWCLDGGITMSASPVRGDRTKTRVHLQVAKPGVITMLNQRALTSIELGA